MPIPNKDFDLDSLVSRIAKQVVAVKKALNAVGGANNNELIELLYARCTVAINVYAEAESEVTAGNTTWAEIGAQLENRFKLANFPGWQANIVALFETDLPTLKTTIQTNESLVFQGYTFNVVTGIKQSGPIGTGAYNQLMTQVNAALAQYDI